MTADLTADLKDAWWAEYEIADPKDTRSYSAKTKTPKNIIKMIFDGKSTLGDDEFEREAVWIKEFNSNTNYNAIKIESITRECPDVSVDPVDPAASEEDKAIA